MRELHSREMPVQRLDISLVFETKLAPREYYLA